MMLLLLSIYLFHPFSHKNMYCQKTPPPVFYNGGPPPNKLHLHAMKKCAILTTTSSERFLDVMQQVGRPIGISLLLTLSV